MKNDRVYVFRQAIGKVIEMLVDRKIEVTQRGTDAYVQADPKTGRPFLINIPHVPDNASDDLLDAIGGFVDHEIGHVLETDFEQVKEGHKYGGFVVSMHNVLEDIRIERLMEKRFRGSVYNLRTLHKFFLEKMTAPMLNDALRSGDKNRVIAVLVPPLFRSMAGQSAFEEFMNATMMGHIKEFYDAVKHLAPELAKMTSTKDALILARKIDACARVSGGSAPHELREGKGPSEKSEKAKIGKEEKSKKPVEKKSSAKPETEVIDEKAESLEAGGLDEELESRAAAPAVESEEAVSEETEELDLEEDESTSAHEEDEIGDFEEPGSSSGSRDDTEDFADPEEGGGTSGSTEDFEERGVPPSYDLDAVGSGIGDFDAGAGKMIGEETLKATEVATYKVFTHDFDVIEPLPLKYGASNDHVTRLEDKVLHMVGPMQKDLERIISARSLQSWSGGHRSGKLHGASLTRIITGDPRVFRRRHETETKDVALSLVVDASGSMDGSKIYNATCAAYALSQVLERIGIKHEVIAFTTLSRTGAARKAESAIREAGIASGSSRYKSGAKTVARWEPLYMPVIKGFDERIDSQVKLRFASLPMMDLCNNVDGECVSIAARRLMSRKEKGKTMIVLSDGNPAADGDMKALSVHLKKVVQDIEAAKVRIVGLGIQSEAVKAFYKRHVILNDVKDLPTIVMKELKTALLD